MSDDNDGIDRRRLLELTGVATTMSALSGCSGAIEDLVRGADEAHEEFEARSAGFSESGATSLGLGSMETVSYDTRREPTVGGETYIVDETHKITTYGGDADRRYRLGVFSTPGARIDDTRTNPVADQDLGSFLTGQHGTRLLDEMGVPNEWVNGPERVDRKERAGFLTSQWPLEVYGGEFPSDRGLFGRRVAIIRGVDYDGGEVVVAVCTGTDASPDDVAEWERAQAILDEPNLVGFEPSWSGSQVPELDIADLRPVQTVEDTAVEGEASVSDPSIVMDEPAALLFDVESDADSPLEPSYLRARILLDRDRRERVREEFDIRYGMHSPDDVGRLLSGVPESAVFHEAADKGTWRYGSREWSIAPPLLELSGRNLSATLELTTPIGNRVARQEIEEGKDFETGGVPTLRVGFIELQDPGVIRSTDIDYGTPFGRAKFYDRSVRSSFEFLRRVFPGQVVAYKHENPTLGNVKELYDDGTGKDAAEARKVLNNICGRSSFPSDGTVLTGDIDRSEAVEMMDAEEGGGLDAHVMILPKGIGKGKQNYFAAHGMDDTVGYHWSSKQAVGSLEAVGGPGNGSDRDHATTTAQEVGHRFAQQLYDGALAQVDDDGDKDSWHAANKLESVGYDLTEGVFSLVTDPQVIDGVFSIDDPRTDDDDDTLVEKSYPSYMSYAGVPTWADSRVHDVLIDGSYTPGYQGPASTSGSAGAAAAQRGEGTDARGEVQPVIEAFGSVGDGGVQFSSSAVHDAIPGDADGDEFDPERHPEATPVEVTLRDPNDETLVTVTVPDRTEGTHHQRDHESVAISLPFHEAGVTVVTSRDDERTKLNAVVDPLRDAVGRVPDRGTGDRSALSAAEETLDEVANLMADDEFGAAADRLDDPFRTAIEDGVRAEYDRFANEPVREEVTALTERMITRLRGLGNQGRRLECGTQLPPEITEDTVLQRGCQYTVQDDGVYISQDATLSIEPGVEIEVDAGNEFIVSADGTISAQGTEDEPIEFYGSTEQRGHWHGIEINSDDPDNELSHVNVANAGGGFAAIFMHRVDAAQATIRNCTVRASGAVGIAAERNGDLVDFRNNHIENAQGPPIHIHPAQLASLTGTTTFANNDESHVLVQPDMAYGGRAITEDGTWPALDLPYEVPGEIDIQSEIDIDPGATFQFQQGGPIRLFVSEGGQLVADASEGDPITLRGVENSPGSWGGLFIRTTADNLLDNVVVRHGGGGYRGANVGVDIDGEGVLTIRNSTIEDGASAGVNATNSAELAGFENNTFQNMQGPPLDLHPNRMGDLGGTSTFRNNEASYVLVGSDDNNVTGDGTWPAMDIPYQFNSTVSIQAEIDIDSGATLEFRQGGPRRLFVGGDGQLVADASDGDPITFRGVEDSPGSWGGLFIRTTADNLLDNVVVSDGGGGYRGANIGVGIDAPGSLTVQNSEISDSAGWGIILDTGTLTEENNTFQNNADGAVQRPE
jgi:hypothetical protein